MTGITSAYLIFSISFVPGACQLLEHSHQGFLTTCCLKYESVRVTFPTLKYESVRVTFPTTQLSELFFFFFFFSFFFFFFFFFTKRYKPLPLENTILIYKIVEETKRKEKDN